MPELALDDGQRDAFSRHLDRVRVSKLMRREPPPDTSGDGKVTQHGPSG